MNHIKKIATLGPVGTFSAAATARYAQGQEEAYEIIYFSTIGSALKSIGKGCDVGVLPIENFSEGFIPLVLDLLIDANLTIIGEVLLSVHFSMVSNAGDISEIDQLLVQFVAKGQCSEFIESLGVSNTITTESNIESLERIRAAEYTCAAIVPFDAVVPGEFPTQVENVNDYQNNQTRFLVFSAEPANREPQAEGEYKTSIVVLDDNDHPGVLSEILNSFSRRSINLTSIISRPTRREFGKYHFFIDLDGCISDPVIGEVLDEISQLNKVKLLGSYLKGKLC